MAPSHRGPIVEPMNTVALRALVIAPLLSACNHTEKPQPIDLTRNEAAVATLSTAQVREPIHTRAIQEWRRYEKQLEPLRKALAT